LKDLSKVDASRFLLAIIILLLAAALVFGMYIFRSNPVEDAVSSNRVINVLFVIENEKKAVSTYVLMYYPVTRRAAIFDIPGEIGLLLAKVNRIDRIDSIFDSSRLGLYQNEIEKLLGIEINFSLVITKENLASMVDLLEGVEIFIPSPVSYRDGDTLIMFPSGMTILDGDKASVYATYSLPFEERDMEVFRRQRFFLGFLNREIQMSERLKNPDAAKMFFSLFKTGMNRRTVMLLFNEFVYIDTDRINIQSISGNVQEISGQRLIIPHWNGDLVKEVVRQTLASLTRDVEEQIAGQSLTVEVLNGTAVNGLAGRTAEMLRSFGYDVISIQNADNSNYEDTVIIHRSGSDSMVNEFADIIRCTNIRRELISDEPEDNLLNPDYKADLTLLIGKDFNGRYVTGN
jgi:polyisoprenyl-teichoic acid--peptidoglycan teichoic acid transferase